MGNERKLRLIQVAKEFNVGINTLTDFLHRKGIKSDGSPNTQVDAETYAVLEKEFGANRAAAGARDSIRERISQKQTTITLEGTRTKEREEEQEVVIKSNVINVRDEIPQPKILGKIDLSPKPKAEAPKPAPAKAEAPKAPEKPAAPAKAPEAKAEAPKPAEPAKPAAAAAPVAAEKAVEKAPEKAAEKPADKAPEKAAEKAAEKAPEAPKDNVFRPEIATLTGPQVLGTMDVSGFVPGGKHKRK
ncbi:MAG: translation initiation factor IF-2, partial [Alistipes sp.]|nr:translation initiation factor IF-2 [Alistipes sp.]